MFSSLSLFAQIHCPVADSCQLINCIYSHTAATESRNIEEVGTKPIHEFPKATAPEPVKGDRSKDGPPSSPLVKQPNGLKRRLTSSSREAQVQLEPSRKIAKKVVKREISPPRIRTLPNSPVPSPKPDVPGAGDIKKKPSVLKKPEIVEKLNPRPMTKAPADHGMRYKLLGLIHAELLRLNNEVKKSNDPDKTALELSTQEVITLALDEEEGLAKQSPSLYLNLIKNRIAALKKLKFATWKEERLAQLAKLISESETAKKRLSTINLESGLNAEYDVLIASQWAADLKSLTKHGYVAEPPSREEILQAREGVDTINGWEQCDRCHTRFQVFPGRRAEDGALTSGGSCHYHWGKSFRPQTSVGQGQTQQTFTCCNALLGTPGCTTGTSHVFKISEPKRLALVLPFIKTSKAGSRASRHGVCFDCEMGYTTLGMELIRLTAVSWPSGKPLLDVLVRPIGEILDLNSRFSGVWPDHYKKTPHLGKDSKCDFIDGSTLYLVDSPQVARALFLDHLSETTPVIGHALENDLNSVRLIHPIIIDTVLLYPHRRGLPIRFGLRKLVKEHLNRDIQTAGAEGHDSKEDAIAAGDLVRLRVKHTVQQMCRNDWEIVGGRLRNQANHALFVAAGV